MTVKVYIKSDVTKARGISEIQRKRETGHRFLTSLSGKTSRVNEVLDLMDATYSVPYLMAPGGVVGRGVVGPGYDIVPVGLDSHGTNIKRKRLLDFFSYIPQTRKNIKDTHGPLAKLYTTALMFRLFGHAAWEVVTDESSGRPLGFDLIPGVVKPNVDSDGNFKRPAYVQYLRDGKVEKTAEFDDPANVIYFTIPDFGSGIWLNETLALSDYTLPSEIYAADAYRSLHENRNAPYAGFWYTPADVSDDTFDRFVALIERRYTGVGSYGRSPIVMRGEGGFKSISIPKDDAPYLEGRDLNRKEISAITGVPSPKYGVGVEEVGAGGLEEIRREFYESTLRPIMSLLEEGIYRQVCVGLFRAPEWRFKFGRPDFTTAVEDASIELRRIQWGQWSPNEARASRGESPRDGGDYYLIPSNMMKDEKPGRPDNDAVDDETGDMEPEDEDRVPETEPPVKVDELVSELRAWKKFEIRVAKGIRQKREFVPDKIPYRLYRFIQLAIAGLGADIDGVSGLFDSIIEGLGS